jgi:hypothetical protein
MAHDVMPLESSPQASLPQFGQTSHSVSLALVVRIMERMRMARSELASLAFKGRCNAQVAQASTVEKVTSLSMPYGTSARIRRKIYF